MKPPPTDPNPFQPPAANLETELDPAMLPGQRLELAGRWRRLLGAVIDALFLSFTGLPAMLAGAREVTIEAAIAQSPFRFVDTSLPGLISSGVLLVVLAIQSYFIHTRGQSVGKRVCSTRIVGLDGQRVPFVKAVVLRTWAPLALPLLPVIGGVLSLVDVLFVFRADRRCCHDLVAGTRVVRTTGRLRE
jgi:uncharacterized RDD family membrane protein YckC